MLVFKSQSSGDRVVKHESREKQHHFQAKGSAGETLHRLGGKKHGACYKDDDQAAERPWLEFPRQPRQRATGHYDSHQAQIQHEYRSKQERQCKDVNAFKRRKNPC